MLYIFTQHYFRQEVEQRAPLLNHTYRHIPRKKTTLQPCPLSFRNMYKFRRTINSAILRIPHYGVAIALISRNCLIFLRGDKFGRYFKPRCWKTRMVFFRADIKFHVCDSRNALSSPSRLTNPNRKTVSRYSRVSNKKIILFKQASQLINDLIDSHVPNGTKSNKL